MQPFDQEAWAKRYAGYSVEAALATFSALRQWNLALVRSLGAADLAKPVNHPERGDMTLANHRGNHGRPRSEPPEAGRRDRQSNELRRLSVRSW